MYVDEQQSFPRREKWIIAQDNPDLE